MLKEKFHELQQRLLQEIRSFYGSRLISVVVFGSVARETYRHNSDIDILIVSEDLPNGRMKRVKEFSQVEDRIEPFIESLKKEGIDTYISPIFKTSDEVETGSPLFLDMVEDARILYDKNDFFKHRMDRLKKRLKELGSKRVWRGSTWHWVLKPDYKPGDVIEL
jgi:hypothetical protein